MRAGCGWAVCIRAPGAGADWHSQAVPGALEAMGSTTVSAGRAALAACCSSVAALVGWPSSSPSCAPAKVNLVSAAFRFLQSLDL